jgi:hypothetical protein
MGGDVARMRDVRNACKTSVWKAEVKRPLGILRLRWENNSGMSRKGIRP